MEKTKDILTETRDNWKTGYAKKLIELGISDELKAALENEFPELVESEDERIRRALIKQFSAISMETWAGIPKIDIIAYLEKQKEQKPAGWSEEDEQMLQAIIKRYEFAVESDCAVFIKTDKLTQMEKELAWLKSLHPQPKAELTLLDENIINAAVAFVEQNNHFNCWLGVDKHTVIKALRSLKPH